MKHEIIKAARALALSGLAFLALKALGASKQLTDLVTAAVAVLALAGR